MTEAFDQWQFVIAAYVLGGATTLGLAAYSWLAMGRAEARRDKVREG